MVAAAVLSIGVLYRKPTPAAKWRAPKRQATKAAGGVPLDVENRERRPSGS